MGNWLSQVIKSVLNLRRRFIYVTFFSPVIIPRSQESTHFPSFYYLSKGWLEGLEQLFDLIGFDPVT